MKYIITEAGEVVVFSPTIGHDHMASCIGQKVRSAGFVNDKWTAYGESISLGIKSAPNDTEFIKRILSL